MAKTLASRSGGFGAWSALPGGLLAGQTTYEPLFAGLDVEDQASIVAILKEEKIPYRIDPGANAILVPRETVYETRLALAQEGLPRGGSVGYELFDDSKMGMSDFQQKIAYLRALEGELTRTVQEIDAVEYAKVNIVIPEQRLFLEQQQPSTASVLVRLRPGKNRRSRAGKGHGPSGGPERGRTGHG